MKNLQRLLTSLSLAALTTTPAAAKKIQVAASTPDLASIAAALGGDKLEVFSIAKARANPHFVEVLPSYMIRVSRAALYLKSGLSLDPWADPIIDGSRNSRLKVVDCSAGIEVLEKPEGKVDASRGDVHPQGNPHYWLEPANGLRIAENILVALKQVDARNAAAYDANAAVFMAELEKRRADWAARMKPLEGAAIVAYHSSWVYLAHAFSLRIVGYVEPYPGIPPTAKHLQELMETIRSHQARILIQEPFYPEKDPKFLARQTGIQVFRFAPSCDGMDPGAYLRHLEEIVTGLSGMKP
jgi:zinc/manganese transport system substrate-binding protein